MIFISWINSKHPKPMQASDVFNFAASQMASTQRDQGYEAKCGAPEQTQVNGKTIAMHDCAMRLPIGSYYASFLQFQHRDIEYFVRFQNASAAPIPDIPIRTARKFAAGLTFE